MAFKKGHKLSPEHKRKLYESSKQYQFKRGQPSANPSGAPKRKPFLAALRDVMKDNPELVRDIIEQHVGKALDGDKDAFRELRDMTDGKPPQAITAGTDDDGNALPMPIINVGFVAPPKDVKKKA